MTAQSTPETISFGARKMHTGVIESVNVVPFGRSSRFAVDLRTASKRLHIIHLPRPTVPAQFVFQLGRRVTLPVERGDKCWELRLDRAALKLMRDAEVYDPGKPPDAFLRHRKHQAKPCRWLELL